MISLTRNVNDKENTRYVGEMKGYWETEPKKQRTGMRSDVNGERCNIHNDTVSTVHPARWIKWQLLKVHIEAVASLLK